MWKKYSCVNVKQSVLYSCSKQKHEKNCTEENAESAHGGDDNLRDHLHVADQWIWRKTSR